MERLSKKEMQACHKALKKLWGEDYSVRRWISDTREEGEDNESFHDKFDARERGRPTWKWYDEDGEHVCSTVATTPYPYPLWKGDCREHGAECGECSHSLASQCLGLDCKECEEGMEILGDYTRQMWDLTTPVRRYRCNVCGHEKIIGYKSRSKYYGGRG